jgi:crotonobetainyl-CoA:carnitine CoA-transferase CaiB-like acyl-CoA transferase
MNDYPRFVAHPQVEHLGAFTDAGRPEAPLRAAAPPWRFADTPATVRLPAPRLGEHTAAVLAEVAATPHA